MLARMQKAMKEKDEGFTLIELLVVIIIIGILAAIAIPVFLNQRKKATEASMKSDLRTIANAMETYYVDANVYPDVSLGTDSVTVGAETVNLSKGNTAAATGSMVSTAGSFCVGIYNDEVGGISEAIFYSSAKGGLQPKGGTC